MPGEKTVAQIERAIALLNEAASLIVDVNDENDGNEHLLSYAADGIGSTLGYLGTYRRRLDDPESD